MTTPMNEWSIRYGRRDVTPELELFESPRAGDWEIYHRGQHLGSIRDGKPALFATLDAAYQLTRDRPRQPG